jgi:hypothetical protein
MQYRVSLMMIMIKERSIIRLLSKNSMQCHYNVFHSSSSSKAAAAAAVNVLYWCLVLCAAMDSCSALEEYYVVKVKVVHRVGLLALYIH